MTFTQLFCSVAYAFDVVLYTGMCHLLRFLPDSFYSYLLPMLFSVNVMGSMEKGDCVYLVNHSDPFSDNLAISSSCNYVTTSPEEALEISESLEIPIQTIVCYYSREYFSEGWVYPQPYELVYEYGAVEEAGSKTAKEYHEYFFDKMSSRPSVRLYEPPEEQSGLLFMALMCSRYSVLLVYLLLRYQWYNRICFRTLLVAAVIASAMC